MEKTYTQADFDNLPYNVREGVLNFYDFGYDYSDDSDVWDGREDDEYCTLADLKKGCQIYDFLQKKGEQTRMNTTVTYGVHLKDAATGKTTRIDIIDVPEGYTVEDYVNAYKDQHDAGWLDKLNTGTLSLVRLPVRSKYTLPMEIPDDGPQDIV